MGCVRGSHDRVLQSDVTVDNLSRGLLIWLILC